MGVRSSASFLV